MNREDNFVVKSDYHLNTKNIITGRFFYANSLQTEEDTLRFVQTGFRLPIPRFRSWA